jgi:hypothetical protein
MKRLANVKGVAPAAGSEATNVTGGSNYAVSASTAVECG